MITLSIIGAIQGTAKEKIQMIVVSILLDCIYIVPLITSF
jgi:hypothetical protein